MQSATDLLVDLGNSRLKWAVADAAGLGPSHQIANDSQLEQALTRQWGELAAPRQVALVSVAGDLLQARVTEWIGRRWDCRLKQARAEAKIRIPAGAGRQLPAADVQLVNSYANPGQMGADRWIAMLGARSRCSGAFAVVDAGTALTVDVVDHAGQHLGGWILPGRALMHQSLDRGTAAVRPTLIDSAAAFGQDTRSCVAGGVSAAVLGALALMSRQLPTDCRVWVCGGDGEWLSQHFERAEHEADLVLQGLRVWLQNS